MRPENVGAEVILPVLVDSHIGPSPLIRRWINHIDGALFRHLRWRNVLPVLPVITRYVNQSVVTTDPKDPWLDRRFLEGKYRGVEFDTRVVMLNRASRNILVLVIIGGEVRTDNLPTLSAVGGAMDILRCVIENVWVMR